MTEAEFERFYGETVRELYGYLSRVGGFEGQLDDFVQSAYMRFLGARRRPKDARARRVYLFRIARNLVRDELRRRAKEQRRASEQRSASSLRRDEAPPSVSCESKIEVRRALAALSPRIASSFGSRTSPG